MGVRRTRKHFSRGATCTAPVLCMWAKSGAASRGAQHGEPDQASRLRGVIDWMSRVGLVANRTRFRSRDSNSAYDSADVCGKLNSPPVPEIGRRAHE
jgi:hypothetical protein